MNPPIEIIMPVRNAGSVLKNTIQCLVAQTNRNFSVLISDNFSTKGLEEINDAERTLHAAGISVRRVKPPRDLKRVQHWNYAHSQSTADWLKPLFVGDELAPAYIEKILERIHSGTRADLIRCEFEWKTPDFTNTAVAPTRRGFITPAEFLNYFPHYGNWLGSPINMCYRRSAFFGAGGYSIHFPACADYNLYVRLTLGNGLEMIHEFLATLRIHEERFSHKIGARRVVGCLEVWIILVLAKIYCENNKLEWPEDGITSGVWKQFRMDYYFPWQERLKKRLLGKRS